MPGPITNILSHVSLGTNNLTKSAVFYDQVLETLGIGRLMEHPGALAYGRELPEFWLQTPSNGATACVGNGTHIGFAASTQTQVQAFHRMALHAGGQCEGKPGPRQEYGKPYYGCFLRDLDGHKIEAVFWDFSLT